MSQKPADSPHSICVICAIRGFNSLSFHLHGHAGGRKGGLTKRLRPWIVNSTTRPALFPLRVAMTALRHWIPLFLVGRALLAQVPPPPPPPAPPAPPAPMIGVDMPSGSRPDQRTQPLAT